MRGLALAIALLGTPAGADPIARAVAFPLADADRSSGMPDVLGGIARGLGGIGAALGRWLGPPDTEALARWTDTAGEDSLHALMEAAGFRLERIDSSVGLPPRLVLHYARARDLTAADEHWVRRRLQRHAREHAGPGAAAARGIVGAALDSRHAGRHGVATITVQLMPLPRVSFSLVPNEP